MTEDLTVLGHLHSMEVGEIAEAPTLMKGLTSEPVVLQVIKKTKHATHFQGTFYGAKVFIRSLSKSADGGFQWT